MESNKDEARRAVDIAERKISEEDYVGAKKFINKAQKLFPELDGLKQVMTVINVYISAPRKINGGREADWYRILGVDPLADGKEVKKQYKKLALLLHPDKNKCKGAEDAFKLVSEAWSLLSDKEKRIAFDQKRAQKPQNQHKTPSTNGVDPSAKARAPVNPSKQRGGTFWTMCNRCKTQCQYLKDYYYKRAIVCPNCGHTFIATEKNPRQSASAAAREPPKRRPLRTSVVFPKNSENVANQAQDRSKNKLEKEQERLAVIERVRKKLRSM
ncbi:unnamed protein product [Microthlaspi erraticum]|uniref:J domain-containing protein n=1 Tax=Microthlaspi erraticum TaxID=1685480 RepID=A0A6D2KCX8_9BRAS|nr:unnamed protein product [Microthlaspi erraticum]